MSPMEQDENLKTILGSWPNTYTFTKSMGERTLRKRIPQNMSSVIFRPSIISASIRDPVPGWTDTLSAAGGLSIGGSVGLINYIHGSS